MISRYEKIMDYPHHVSTKHRSMSNGERAAQFASFKALNGYEEAVDETARIVQQPRELDDDRKAYLDEWIAFLRENGREMEISVTFFQADKQKDGGSYCSKNGVFRRIDDAEKMLILQSEDHIPLKDIFDIRKIGE